MSYNLISALARNYRKSGSAFEPQTSCAWKNVSNHYTTKPAVNLKSDIIILEALVPKMSFNLSFCISKELPNSFRSGSNRGPSACKADVITATLRNLSLQVTRLRVLSRTLYLWKKFQNCGKMSETVTPT